MGRPPVLADPNLGWGVEVREAVTALRIPRGYQSILMGDRMALHGVRMIILKWTLGNLVIPSCFSTRPSRCHSCVVRMDTFSTSQLAGPSHYEVPVALSLMNAWLSCGLQGRVTALAHLIATTTLPPSSPKTQGSCTTGSLLCYGVIVPTTISLQTASATQRMGRGEVWQMAAAGLLGSESPSPP